MPKLSSRAGKDDGVAQRATPMIAQYIEIKAANADCLLFYRMGDFYEMFFEDAQVAARALGIALTKRGRHLGEDIPMCGVPVARADDYLQKLIGLGHRVAVCEQLEDPADAKKRGPKAVVRRDVVRLVTPGTITEEALLDPARANAFIALACGDDDRFGCASVDISTGAFLVWSSTRAELFASLARHDPREIVAPQRLLRDSSFAASLREYAPLADLGREPPTGEDAARRLAAFFNVATLNGLGPLDPLEIAAAASAVYYVERTQKADRPALSHPASLRECPTLEIDAATRANLELSRAQSGDRALSLFGALDRAKTPAGARLLAERLSAPLKDVALIARRLDAVAFFLNEGPARDGLRALLAKTPDLARAMSRLALQRGGPRDLEATRAALSSARDIHALLSAKEAPDEVTAALEGLVGVDAALEEMIAGLLAADPPLDRRGGGFIEKGRDPALDEARSLRDESRQIIVRLQERYAEDVGLRSLKIRHNHFLGYYVEVPAAQGERLLQPPLRESFAHRQTMADAMRFSTSELVDLESRIAHAGERALAREFALFDEMRDAVLRQEEALKRLAGALATLDVASALAARALEGGWTRPQVDESLAFDIEGGRHPVVEASLKAQGKAFAANDCDLGGDGAAGRVAVVTGPNMAGKSTFLRQNALIAILAQTGSFVPAERAHIGVVDRLFSRVGASDDLARGRSTFMVEMVETAAILNGATPRSFVILDEIGRGTATFDGLSIAFATMEHLHDVNRSRALFATHFHELTQLSKRLPRVGNLTMKVSDHAGDVVFLHEVVKGAADRSYGVHVAELAGLPPRVVARAHQLLAEMEASERQSPVSALIDDLPLFAASPPPAPQDALRTALDLLEPDAMSPRDALAALYELKETARRR